MRPRRAPGKCIRTGFVAAIACLPLSAETPRSDESRDADRWLYLPPAFAARVVYYHSFETDPRTPEINRIDATVLGGPTPPTSGVNGKGYRCPTGKGLARYSLQSPALCPDRPLTVMTWWRLDAPMLPESDFNVLTLHGKGLLGSFVRGKGEWCALPAPRRIFQVYYFEGISNRNDIAGETILFTRPQWHHTACTVEAGTDIRVYWDGDLKTFYTLRGRPFRPGDISELCPGLRSGSHPMSIDDVIVVDRVLGDDEIAAYVVSVGRLAEIDMPTSTPPP